MLFLVYIQGVWNTDLYTYMCNIHSLWVRKYVCRGEKDGFYKNIELWHLSELEKLKKCWWRPGSTFALDPQIFNSYERRIKQCSKWAFFLSSPKVCNNLFTELFRETKYFVQNSALWLGRNQSLFIIHSCSTSVRWHKSVR